ncbi:MAG: T9SS type A sorting domain-containing protein [Saprospiraceae bacterium]
MKNLFTLLFLCVSLLAFADCEITFTPVNQNDDSLVIQGQGIDTVIYSTVTLNFNGDNTDITFTYGGTNGASFSYNCNGQSESLVVNDGDVFIETNPLPVELLYFKYVKEGQYLEWATAWEENNKGFDIEFSLNGESFEKIDFVHGAKTASVYRQDITENGYYRLKQVDFDGQYEYSNIVLVPFLNDNTGFKVLGNDGASGQLDVRGDGIVTITNSLGQVIKTINLTESNQVTLELSDFTSGVYNITLVKSGNIETLRFMKH